MFITNYAHWNSADDKDIERELIGLIIDEVEANYRFQTGGKTITVKRIENLTWRKAIRSTVFGKRSALHGAGKFARNFDTIRSSEFIAVSFTINI